MCIRARKGPVEQLSPTQVRLNVGVPFAELEPDFDRAFKQLAKQVRLPGFRPGRAKQAAPILVHGETAGWLEVHYTRRRPPADDGPFLHDERRLLQAIAGRLAATLEARNERQDASPRVAASAVPEWWTVIEFLRQTDRVLLSRLARKMINHLGWKGVAEAGEMLRRNAPRVAAEEEDENQPLPRSPFVVDAATTESAFRLAASHLNEAEILGCLRSWIREEKTAALKHAVERVDTPLAELVDHLERFRQGGVSEHDLTPATQMGLPAGDEDFGQTLGKWGVPTGPYVVLPLIGLYMPFAVFWMRAHFVNMPIEISEAARVDGASTWSLFWRIHLPLARAPMLSLGILMSVWTWNQFLIALVLVEDPSQRTMAGALGAFQGHYATDVPLLCAGTILIVLPTLVLFVLFQRQMITALLQGSVKG